MHRPPLVRGRGETAREEIFFVVAQAGHVFYSPEDARDFFLHAATYRTFYEQSRLKRGPMSLRSKVCYCSAEHFGDANLHSSARGAELNARAVVEGLRGLGSEDPLGAYLRP